MKSRATPSSGDIALTCECGLTFTKRGALDLEKAGTLKNDGELIELRRCPCSRLLALSRSPDSVRGA